MNIYRSTASYTWGVVTIWSHWSLGVGFHFADRELGVEFGPWFFFFRVDQ